MSVDATVSRLVGPLRALDDRGRETVVGFADALAAAHQHTEDELAALVAPLLEAKTKPNASWLIGEQLRRVSVESGTFPCCGTPFEDGHHRDCESLPRVLR